MGKLILVCGVAIVVVWAVLRFLCIPKILKDREAKDQAENARLTPEQLALKRKLKAAVEAAKAERPKDPAKIAAAKKALADAKANGWKA